MDSPIGPFLGLFYTLGMEILTANISGRPKAMVLDGREYLVTRATLIVPGVLNGSGGPLYYPPEEIQKSVELWNGVPLMLRHPTVNGSPVSANTMEALQEQGIGKVLNAVYDGKLKAEAWFDVKALERLDATLLASVKAGNKIELSTGLQTDNEEHASSVGGKAFDAIARNYRPDHLAVLPDDQGACSVRDGCGISVNQNTNAKESTMDEKEKKALVDFIIANCAYCDEDDREVLNAKTDEKLTAQKEAIEAGSQLETVHNEATKTVEVEGIKFTWNAAEAKWAATKLPKKKDPPVENKTPALTPEQEEDLAFARQVRQERTDKAVASITANKANKLTAEQLGRMPLDVLQNMAASFPQEKPTPNYSGAAGAAQSVVANEESFAKWGEDIEDPKD